ncbi:replication factor C subunit 3-like [Forsythia ovata]|uniref:Replication factor C subunit 3-like n=1 Tax=Forsythia ovata TaxID=205694 RepID=A0ABD1QUI8_9LAMI
MPSPSIPRSKSAPDINSPPSPSNSYIPPSRKSMRSSRSAGSPITAWQKKLGDYITRKKHSNLTAQNLEEFNKSIEARYSNSSPYYKGLTDFSLVINREKYSGTSPGRESTATSFISSSSKSSFVVKVQEWSSSCFTSKKLDKTSSSSSGSSSTKSSHDIRAAKLRETGMTITKIINKTTKDESDAYRKRVTFPSINSKDDTITSLDKEKSLRERDSEKSSMPAASHRVSLQYSPPQQIPSQELSLPDPIPLPHVLLPAQTPILLPPSAVAQATDAEVVFLKNKNISTTESERKYQWADKYRPSCLQDFLCNRETALWLQTFVRNWEDKIEECGHFIFEGHPGVGKRTMIWALLREAFGADKVQVREQCKEFNLKGEAVGSILVNLKVSTQHIEVNLSELKGYEKHIIVELIKDKSSESDQAFQCNIENCKAIILYEADKLSTDALTYIKWILERFKGCNKVFFCCSDISKLLPLKSLCNVVQLLEPSNEEIVQVLEFIAKQEGIQLPHRLAFNIASSSKNNLRQAIRSFEATWNFNSSLTEDQDIKSGWEDKIAKLAKNIIEEQSPKQLYNIRGELQNLIEHKVAPEFIFKTLVEELKKNLDCHLQPKFDNLYDEYQRHHGSKQLMCSPQNKLEEHGKRQNDPRKDVHQFMRIEGKKTSVM